MTNQLPTPAEKCSFPPDTIRERDPFEQNHQTFENEQESRLMGSDKNSIFRESWQESEGKNGKG